MNRVMKRTMRTAAVIVACAAWGGVLMLGQPKPKSAKEGDAIRAIQAAVDPDARLKAIDDVLTTYADTEYKILLLQMAVGTAQQKGDFALTTTWAERTLDADPKNVLAMLALAQGQAMHTREFDLDKEAKLAKGEKYAHAVLDALKDAPKFRTDISDEQWVDAKKGLAAQAHESLGIMAAVRKNYVGAVAEYKLAIAASGAPEPTIETRMGDAYARDGKYDEAIAAFDKAMAAPDVSAQVKQVAQNTKASAMRKKAAGAAPAATAPASAVQQVEIEKKP